MKKSKEKRLIKEQLIKKISNKNTNNKKAKLPSTILMSVAYSGIKQEKAKNKGFYFYESAGRRIKENKKIRYSNIKIKARKAESMKIKIQKTKTAINKKLCLSKLEKKIKDRITECKKLASYETDYVQLAMLDNKRLTQDAKKAIKKARKLSPKLCVVVGIGGSNLGALAVYEAIKGKSKELPFFLGLLKANAKEPVTRRELKETKARKIAEDSPLLLFADTTDSSSLTFIISLMRHFLDNGDNVIINCITKSGRTTETIANFQVLLEVLKRYKKSYKDYVYITTAKGSSLWNAGKKEGFYLLEIPKKLGGRFSVLSNVGLFPLGLAGINIDELVRGAREMKSRCLKESLNLNPAAKSSLAIFCHNKLSEEKKNIHDTFLFYPDYESLGKWYRQLMSECLGKELSLDGKKVNEGITPTVSIGTTDLHSMVQLYLGGPSDRLTTFIALKKKQKKALSQSLKIKKNITYSNIVENIQGKNIDEIMDAIYLGVKRAFVKAKKPFIEVIIPENKEYFIGQLLQLKMMEIVFLGKLLNVNPFNQPKVELYKEETRKLLKKE